MPADPHQPTDPVPPDSAGRQGAERPQAMSRQQALQLAEQHEAAGRLQQAELVVRSILKAYPEDAKATHLLGIIAYRAGKPDVAIQLLEQAIGFDANVASFHSNLCEMHRQQGHPHAALPYGQAAVALEPNSHAALSNLGIVHYDLQNHTDAEQCQRKALELCPHYPQAENNLASIQRAKHATQAAIETYREVLKHHPEYVEALSNLGATLTEDEQPEQAVLHLQQALRLAPDHAEAHCNLGVAYITLEKMDDAIDSLQRALRIRADYPAALRGLSGVWQHENYMEQAEKLAQAAVRLEPENAAGHLQLGRIHKEQGFPELAAASYSHALTLDPGLISGHLASGHLLMELGDLVQAEETFRHALSINADSLQARLAISQVRKARPEDENMQALVHRSAQLDSMHELKAMPLHFALGKCYDDVGEPDKAFPHFLEACRLKRKRIQYSAAGNTETCKRIKEYFCKERIEKRKGGGHPSNVPVFVLGMPRSGTTLTEQILASHSNVHGAGELHDLLHIANHPHPSQESLTEPYPLCLGSLDHHKLAEMGARYVAGLAKRAPEAQRITDKMPANYACIGLIHLILPNAKIVHVKRNPIDTCLSQFTRLFNKGQYQSYDLMELGLHYRDYSELMQHWRDVLPPHAFYEVQYEELVTNIGPEARKLLDYCELDWEDACLDFHKTKRSIRTASVTQVRQPVYRSSVERWRKYESEIGSLIEALGDLVESP